MFWEWCEDGLQARCAPPPRFPEATGCEVCHQRQAPHTNTKSCVFFQKRAIELQAAASMDGTRVGKTGVTLSSVSVPSRCKRHTIDTNPVTRQSNGRITKGQTIGIRGDSIGRWSVEGLCDLAMVYKVAH